MSDFNNTVIYQGLKEGVKILLHNPPPSEEEILDSELFFARLIDFR